jgi:hypothetical protein
VSSATARTTTDVADLLFIERRRKNVAKLNDDPGGVNTPESAVLTGIANLFKLVFVTGAIAFA